ncbi:MAG: NYN domain-containing protein [Acidobacteriota bacterium]
MTAPRPITYLFIDGGYLKKAYSEGVSEWFEGEGGIDFSQVAGTFSANKTFYYDCLDDVRRPNESESDFDSRVRAQRSDLNKIREVRGCHIKLGHLLGSKEKNKRQKEVDVLLTVDMMAHASRKNMDKAVLLSGDRDFKPLVEALVQMGSDVEVAADAKSVSEELSWAADSFKRLDFYQYWHWSTEPLRSKYPIPRELHNAPAPSGSGVNLLKTGSFEDVPLELYAIHNEFQIYIPSHAGRQSLAIQFNDENRLNLYFRLRHGEITWT